MRAGQQFDVIVFLLVAGLMGFGVCAYGEDDAGAGIELEGYYSGPGTIWDTVTVEDDGGAGEEMMAQAEEIYRPVLAESLVKLVNETASVEHMTVIVFLDYQPQEQIRQAVEAKYKDEIEQLRQEAKAINAVYAAQRNVGAAGDVVNYRDEVLTFSAEDKATMRWINEELEAVAYAVQEESSAILREEIDAYQASVKEAIEGLGGTVSAGLITGNTIIAKVPAGMVAQLAGVDKVARVVEDKLMDAHLNIADSSTLANVGLTGGSLWTQGQTGGTYDAAVMDSGTDLDHPALEDSGSRTNYSSYYLVEAYANRADNDWDDAITVDDNNGHGTHVIGIVGSYDGTYAGMAYGVDKLVTLKAGFNKTTGGASMYWTDAMALVDRALHNTSQLNPNTFGDDVDGINLSYGGETEDDETDYSRFWDSVVHSHTDLFVTISAGNSGPSNAYFNSPACAYNPMVVANMDDQNTSDRDDDVIRSSSTRGPTEDGRRKPDITAPGTYIMSANHDWEGFSNDFISKSGTSMSAPMVQGIGMCLMDAGVTDELELKALLINTAQKNNTAMDFESDSDGWSETYGWGYMNAWAAYYHRYDTFKNTLTPRNTTGSYHLYKGVMRDEGASNGDGGASSGEGRDRATMVWNRHATYTASSYPSTYYSLSDLNMRAYRESDNYNFDTDLTSSDNVHQVRIYSGAGDTDTVVKVYSWATSFAHGGSTEEYALATEEDFMKVDFPTDFQGIAIWPSEVEPGEQFDVQFRIRNDSDIASHYNTFEPSLPTGWSIVSGSSSASMGSIEGEGGYSSYYTWTFEAQNSVEDSVSYWIQHSHNSYGEDWGPYNWHLSTDVKWDTTAPTPNPMTFVTEPYGNSTTSAYMYCSLASDVHDPVYYYFDYTGSATGGTGGSDSGWQTSRSYSDTGLQPNNQYNYRVRARDSATSANYTSYSGIYYAETLIETPTGIVTGTITPTSIQVRSLNTPTNLNVGNSGLLIQNYTKGTNSGYQHDNDYWTCGGLSPNTHYYFRAKARNIASVETAYSALDGVYSAAVIPEAASISNVTPTSLTIELPVDANPSYTQYTVYLAGGSTGYYLADDGSSNGATPLWQVRSNWNTTTVTGLDSSTSYTVWVRAQNQDGIVTTWRSAVVTTAGLCGDAAHPYPTADISHDCYTDTIDLNVMAYRWLDIGCSSMAWCSGADLDHSNTVDLGDFAILANDWMNCTDPEAPCLYLP